MDEEKNEPSDPVELKRMTFQTPAMKDHPPITVDELFYRIDDLKAENNSKFSQEYEVLSEAIIEKEKKWYGSLSAVASNCDFLFILKI